METPTKSNGFSNTKAVQHLQQKLNDDKTVEAIDRLLDRIDTLEKAVSNLTTIMNQGPGLVAMTMDMVDEGYRKANSSGVVVEDRLKAALHLAEKLTAPAMLEKLEKLFEMVDQAPGLVAMTMDMVDEGYRKATSQGVSVEDRLNNALTLANKLTDPEMVEKLDGLFKLADQAPGLVAMTMDTIDEEMGKLASKNIDFMSLLELINEVGKAVSEARHMPHTKVKGLVSMWRTMRDPERQKAIGFIMNVAKAYGKRL